MKLKVSVELIVNHKLPTINSIVSDRNNKKYYFYYNESEFNENFIHYDIVLKNNNIIVASTNKDYSNIEIPLNLKEFLINKNFKKNNVIVHIIDNECIFFRKRKRSWDRLEVLNHFKNLITKIF